MTSDVVMYMMHMMYDYDCGDYMMHMIYDYDCDDVYDVYNDSRRYTNATNTPTSDIMKEMVPYLPHRSSSVCVVYWEGWGRLLVVTLMVPLLLHYT